jgi:hypothetical protein
MTVRVLVTSGSAPPSKVAKSACGECVEHGLLEGPHGRNGGVQLTGVVLMSPALSRPEPPPVRRMLGAMAVVAPWMPIPRRRRPVAELSRLPAVGSGRRPIR